LPFVSLARVAQFLLELSDEHVEVAVVLILVLEVAVIGGEKCL
jgi:hypothetical protein